jgi:ATP-dependent exoDNAse (exonuclease V) beta subunit
LGDSRPLDQSPFSSAENLFAEQQKKPPDPHQTHQLNTMKSDMAKSRDRISVLESILQETLYQMKALQDKIKVLEADLGSQRAKNNLNRPLKNACSIKKKKKGSQRKKSQNFKRGAYVKSGPQILPTLPGSICQFNSLPDTDNNILKEMSP